MICYLYRYIYGGEQVKKELERLAEGWAISKQCFGTKSGARKGAFTLAEVLITLGIIGVVAALTLPSLIQKYQEQVLENQLKKMYSTISQGIQKAMAFIDSVIQNFFSLVYILNKNLLPALKW